MNRRLQWILAGCLFLIAAVLLCLILIRRPQSTPTEPPETEAPTGPRYPQRTTADDTPTPTEPLESDETIPYESPVDFDVLWQTNPDIYAWLEIPNTDISYPLLQSSSDDTYYLDRGADGEYDYDGSLFTESTYNNRDFTDPLTVVYGHNKRDGKMFSNLQLYYSSQEDMAEREQIIIYLPDRELHFSVFAAVPFDNRHILYNYDFTDERTFRLFFREVLSVHAMEAVYAEDALVLPEEQTLILSTCLEGNRAKRFLLCAKLTASVPDNSNS